MPLLRQRCNLIRAERTEVQPLKSVLMFLLLLGVGVVLVLVIDVQNEVR